MTWSSVLLMVLTLAWHALAGETQLALVPRARIFRATFADPREVKMALSFEGDSRLNAAIGNYFSLFGLVDGDNGTPFFHLGLEGAGYFGLVQADRRFPLESSDGLIGAYAEGTIGHPNSSYWQFRYTHISAHLADGSSDTPIAYSREHVALRFAHNWDESLTTYLGIYYIVNAIPSVSPAAFQLGVNYFAPWGFAQLLPFLGIDFKWKSESEVNPSFDAQCGIALSNPKEAYRSLRIFYAYHTGSDVRGQYFNRVSTTHALGIEMQI